MSKRYYITTAIDYVNGAPHIGHAYEKVITDVIARAHVSLGEEVFYLTGLDEHGQKVQNSAVELGKSAQEYCDELAGTWKSFAERLNLANADFVRTTSPPHKKVVRAVLEKLEKSGHFYREKYSGSYSIKQEQFLTDQDREEDGSFGPQWGEVIELEEENYNFKMGAHQQWLIDYIESNPDFVQPDYRRNEVLGFLKNNELGDLCSSRPKGRLSWGIPFPFDPEYVTYVWFDALTNYISIPAAHGDRGVLEGLGLNPEEFENASDETELWPADVHVIGKDILRFHAVYWPIMLKAMGLPLPKQVLVHGFWQKDGEKISKATGNTIDPIEVIDEWGIDAFRYYVVRELDIGPDGNWTDEGFASRYNNLANGIGNLVNRSLAMTNRYREGVIAEPNDDLREVSEQTVAETTGHLRNNRLQAGLYSINKLIDEANSYIDRTAPFKLAKDPGEAGRVGEILYNLVEVARILGVLLWPYVPGTSEKIYEQLGIEGAPDRLALAVWGGVKGGHHVGKPSPLFPRKDLGDKAKK
ncbi:MAG: methionine--tRNA ligase [Verrucomicrobiales bacterium]|nr:methionine--tRNA ligase [Verrucomicrobiales bacterium]|tara:strand:+ start:1298 stop:2878 length:1581 start_codon:yes stop_codon:yes gene_type:complete